MGKTLKVSQHTKLITFFIGCLLSLSTSAQVTFPNGTPGESVIDLRVKVLGGFVTLDRQFHEGRWALNLRWRPAILEGQPQVAGGCTVYPQVRLQDRLYDGDGQSWSLENRYIIRATDYLPGEGCEANRIRTLRWQDRNTGQWMEYQRTTASQLDFDLVRYGNRNDVTVSLDYDTDRHLQTVRDHFGRNVLTYHYTGEQLTKVCDDPALIGADPATKRCVAYHWSNTTNSQGTTYLVITRVTDVLGYDTQYEIAQGQLTAITNAEGHTSRYTYTADRVTTYTDAEGNTWQYLYDYDNLKKLFYVRITSPETEAGRRIEELWYNLDGIVVQRDLNGQTQNRLTENTSSRNQTRYDAAGRQTEIQQDEFGNITKTVYPDGALETARYSPVHGQVLEQTDTLGVRTLYDYDSRGNLVRKTEAAGLPEQRITEYEVDQFGQRLRIIHHGGEITLPNNEKITIEDAAISYQYDQQGNLTHKASALKNSYSFTPNIEGRPLQYSNPDGHTTYYTYDAKGHTLSQKNPLGYEIHYHYDKNGNQIQITDPLKNIWRINYDKKNREVKRINPLNQTEEKKYDAIGNLITQIDSDGKPQIIHIYDDLGRLIKSTDAEGNYTKTIWSEEFSSPYPIATEELNINKTYTYNNRDWLVSTQETAKNTTSSEKENISTIIERNVYDKKGQIIEKIDKKNRTTRYIYDALGRLVQQIDPSKKTTIYTWDYQNNLIAITDAQGSITRYTYDLDNHRTSEIKPQSEKTYYQYGKTGLLIQRIDPNGNKLSYSYDKADRRIQEKHTPAEESTATRIIAYTWNAADQLTDYTDINNSQENNFSNSANYTLDQLGRILEEKISYGNQTYTQNTIWLTGNRKASYKTVDGQILNYTWSAGNLESIHYPEGGIYSINERRWNLPVRTILPGGVTETYEWDSFGRQIGLTVITPDQNVWGCSR